MAAPRLRISRRIGSSDNSFSPEKAWQELSKNIKDILKHNASHLSFEDNYRLAYRLVIYKKGPLLYNGVKELIGEELENLATTLVIPAFPSTSDDSLRRRTEEELLLRALREAWDYHATGMRLLGEVLKYMDRTYTQSAGVPRLSVMGSELFVTHIINKPSIKAQVIMAISNQLQRELDGDTINRTAIEECVDIFLKVEASRGAAAFDRDISSGGSRNLQIQNGELEAHSYGRAEILHLIRRAIFSSENSSADHAETEDSLSLSYPPSEYSAAPSRTDTTDYGIYARRMALSQDSFDSDLENES